MTEEPPTGAFTEERRLKLRDSDISVRSGKYYAVYVAPPEMTSYKVFNFNGKPPDNYYFDNYFHALAFFLRLQAKEKAKNHD